MPSFIMTGRISKYTTLKIMASFYRTFWLCVSCFDLKKTVIWIRDLMIFPQQLQQLIRLHPLSLSKKPSLTMKNPRNLRRFPRTRLLPCSVKSFPSSIVKACRRTSRAASWCLKVHPKGWSFRRGRKTSKTWHNWTSNHYGLANQQKSTC